MKKVFTKSDFLVIKSFKNERGSEVIPESELNKHAQVLFKGSRLEATIWSKAPNEEVRAKIGEWCELRARIRQPLPSENLQKLQEQLEKLEESFKPILAREKQAVAQALAKPVSNSLTAGQKIGY